MFPIDAFAYQDLVFIIIYCLQTVFVVFIKKGDKWGKCGRATEKIQNATPSRKNKKLR